MAVPASTIEHVLKAHIEKLVRNWENDEASKLAYERFLKITLSPDSTPESLVKHHIKTISEQSENPKNKLPYAFVIAKVLYNANKTLNVISQKDLENMYSWYKFGMGIELGPQPNLAYIKKRVFWNIYNAFLDKAKLDPAITADWCQKKYLSFILSIFENENLKPAVLKVFADNQAANRPEQPKKSQSFFSRKPKPVDKAAAETAQKPVLFTTTAQTAAGNSAAATGTAASLATPAPLVAANKSKSDPTSNPDKKKPEGLTLT